MAKGDRGGDKNKKKSGNVTNTPRPKVAVYKIVNGKKVFSHWVNT